MDDSFAKIVTIDSDSSGEDDSICKKLKTHNGIGINLDKKKSIKNNDETSKEDSKSYPQPPGTLLSLIVLLLKNGKSLMVQDIWDPISSLFPYYKKKFTTARGIKNIHLNLKKHSEFFLTVPVKKIGGRKVVTLNPLKKIEQDKLIRSLLLKTDEFVQSLHNSDSEEFDKLFTEKWNDNKESTTSSEVLNIDKDEPLNSSSSTDGGTQADHDTDDSMNTIIFDPIIGECRTVNDENDEDYLALNEKPVQLLQQIEENQYLIFQNDNSDFANTVWSSKGRTETVPVRHVDEYPKDQNFPEVENMLPTWKKLFPFMKWLPKLDAVSCSLCQQIFFQLGSTELAVFSEVLVNTDIFNVPKSLRDHKLSRAHKSAEIILDQNIISALHFLLKQHLNEFKSLKEITEAFETLHLIVTNETLRSCISTVSLYLEETILYKMISKELPFTIIADECNGILIVRFVDGFKPKEHIISSFMVHSDQNPIEYLSSLGVSREKMVGITRTAKCGTISCPRCSNPASPDRQKNKTCLRLPILDKFLNLLWKTKLLKPINSIFASIYKLLKYQPHKFAFLNDREFALKLSQFFSNPTIFMEVYKNFNQIKIVAEHAFNSTGSMEAFGLMHVKIDKYKYFQVLNISLEKLISSLNLFRCCFPLEPPDSVKLDIEKRVEELQNYCHWIKVRMSSDSSYSPTLRESDIDEFFSCIETFVAELKRPIYHKGRHINVSLNRMTTLKPLNEINSSKIFQASLDEIYSTLLVPCKVPITKISLHSSLVNFFQKHPHLHRNDIPVVLQYFEDNPDVQVEHKDLLKYFRCVAVFAFEPCPGYERSIYDIRLYCTLLKSSAWMLLGPVVCHQILMITSELGIKNKLSVMDVYEWWVRNSSTSFTRSNAMAAKCP